MIAKEANLQPELQDARLPNSHSTYLPVHIDPHITNFHTLPSPRSTPHSLRYFEAGGASQLRLEVLSCSQILIASSRSISKLHHRPSIQLVTMQPASLQSRRT